MKSSLRQIVSRDTITEIPVDRISSNPHQPRQDFGGIDGLARVPAAYCCCREARQHLRTDPWRTAIDGGTITRMGHHPAIIRDGDHAILAIIENVQRENLNPLEEAEAFRKLQDRGETQQSIADKVGVSRSYIAQKVRLLDLPDEAKWLLSRKTASTYGPMSEGAARQLLRLNILRKVSTCNAFDLGVDFWIDRYCHGILWHVRARTVADIRHEVDYYMMLLWLYESDYRGDEGHARAKQESLATCERFRLEKACRWKSCREPAAFLHEAIQPDCLRLTEGQREELCQAAMRWCQEYAKRHPDPAESVA